METVARVRGDALVDFVILDSPIGPLSVLEDDGVIVEIHFGVKSGGRAAALQSAVAQQLREYFLGDRKTFELPILPRGTPFQLAVWDALQRIPYGETRSYAQIAQEIGRPNAVRAVGAANGANPIPIIVPCHRVIGSNGSLTGFGGGLGVKRRLLELERGERRLIV